MSELAAVEEVENVSAVEAEGRRPVLASGCGAVSTFLAEPALTEPLTDAAEPALIAHCGGYRPAQRGGLR
jgi:hypothetical protein